MKAADRGRAAAAARRPPAGVAAVSRVPRANRSSDRRRNRAAFPQLPLSEVRVGADRPVHLMSRVLKPAARLAGVGDWVGFHTFRHTCATMLFRRSWNAVQVLRCLGHHKPSFIADTYVHLLEGDFPDAGFLDSITGALMILRSQVRILAGPSPTAFSRLSRAPIHAVALECAHPQSTRTAPRGSFFASRSTRAPP